MVRGINLLKVAKELNAGIGAIVDFLKKEGFDIEARPNAKINEDMYNKLLGEFHKNLINKKVIDEINLLEFKPKSKLENEIVGKNKGNLLQDIWQLHTDVQEQMLRLRSVPVRVLPESAKVIGERLYITVNENEKSSKIIEEIASVFKINSNEINTDNGFFFSDTHVVIETKRALSESAKLNFINFQPLPVIDGCINKKKSAIEGFKTNLDKSNFDYRFDEKGRLQITITDLVKLNSLTSEEKGNIKIPEVASMILPISANLKYYFTRNYPFIIDGDSENIIITNTIITKNKYFSDPYYKQLSEEIDLKLSWYKFIFKINPNAVKKYNSKISPYQLPELNKEDNSFCFFVSIERDYSELSKLFEEEKLDFNFKYTRLKRFFDSFFGSQNVTFECVFNYSYNNDVFNATFLEDLNNTNFDNITLSEQSTSVGVDFNWKSESIETLVSNLNEKYPFVYFTLYKNHRCNVDFEIQDLSLDKVENTLREKFPSIQTKRNDKKGTLYFCQEYQTQEQGYRLKQIISSEINTLAATAFEVSLYPIPDDKEKYIIEIDTQAKKETQATAVKELRGADFCVGKSTFGKLFRVNYPQLIFDISGDDFKKTKQLFESHVVKSIEPNLTGDLEKINRLKSSLNNIMKGTKLQNPNLKDFIFDAGKAKKIEDIEYHINPLGETFQELENHLLNSKVNEPQKQAIIKTLLAEDLAVIQGPPGTGKSTAIAEMIWHHVRLNPKERILLTSETNLAVDNAIDRIVNRNHNLVKPIRVGGEEKLEMEGRQFSLDVMKRWVENGTLNINRDEQNNEEETLPQKLILQNWIDNIRQRIDKEEVGEDICPLWSNMLLNPTQEIRRLFYDNYIKNCNLIGATCSSIGKYNQNLSDMFSTDRKRVNIPTQFYKQYCEVFGIKNSYINKDGEHKIKYSDAELKFTTVIQDESSKATPAELSLPLIYGKKNIIIGDHRQLPPLLNKEEFKMSLDFLLDRTEKDEEMRKIIKLKSFVLKHFKEMEISHFERLFEKIDDSLKGVFNLQYRMHPDINEVIKQFYIDDGGLYCGLVTPHDLGVNSHDMNHWASRYHGIEIDGLISKETHAVWVDTKSPELLDGTSRINYGEVEAIREILSKFQQSESFKQYQSFWTNPEDQQIGLISFYGKQIKLLQNLSSEFRDIPIRVSTVDRFQGMERNIIIVSMVRSNRIASDKKQKPDCGLYGELGFPEQKDLGFAQSPNRLNVALSRAKRLLIIVGNSELFRQKPIYNNVYKTIEDNVNGRITKYEVV